MDYPKIKSALRDWASGRILVRKLGVFYATVVAISINFFVVMFIISMATDWGHYSILKAVAVTAGIHILLAPQAYQVFSTMNEIDHVRGLLYNKSITDDLTGAYNRRFFMDELSRLISAPTGGNSRFSIIQFDLDDFKSVNDTYGHAAGDQILRMVANVCQQHARINGVFARLGGEEFAFLLRNLDTTAAFNFAERIRQAVYNSPIDNDGRHISISISSGVSSYAPSLTIDDMLRLGDLAMYQAKANGKNCVVVSKN